MNHKITFAGFASPSIYYIACERNGVDYIPGNCVDIQNPNTGDVQSYSIASSPKNNANLEFYVKVYSGHLSISQYISTLRRGDNLIIPSVPFGTFTPGKDCIDKQYVYIATGAGIAPFLSALGTYSHSPLMILHGGKCSADLIEGWNLSLNYNCKYAISQDKSIYPKRITEYYKDLPTQDTSVKYYLCGINVMVDEANAYLSANGVSDDKIQTDPFY